MICIDKEMPDNCCLCFSRIREPMSDYCSIMNRKITCNMRKEKEEWCPLIDFKDVNNKDDENE